MLTSELYADKIALIGGQPIVALNAFEYFLFVFAHKMVDSSTKVGVFSFFDRSGDLLSLRLVGAVGA